MRHLTTRVKEHSNSTSPSAICNHLDTCLTCKKQFSCDSFKIIDTGRNDMEITIKEALHIKYSQPNLNKQLHGSQGTSFLLNIFK